MKRLRGGARVGATAAVVAAMVLGGAAAANATTTYPEGGTWQYGIREYSSTPYIYSEYYHGSRTHKATTEFNGHQEYSGWKSAGVWAKAPEQAANYTGNGAHWYYDVA